MSRITELYGYSLTYFALCLITVRNEKLNSSDSVVHSVERLIVLLSAAAGLSAAPFRFKLLNVSRVAEHYRAKARSSLCRVYLTLKSACIQKRQESRVVDMSVCQKHEIYLRRCNGYLNILKDVLALLHTKVNEKPFSARLNVCTASCNLVGSADKSHFHKVSSFI